MLWIGWLVFAALLILVELQTGTFYCLLLGAAALLAMAAAFLGIPFFAQCFIFAAAALLLYLVLNPFIRRFSRERRGSKVPLVTERLAGQAAIAISELVPGEVGQVKVDGEAWSAIADERIAAGETVRIIEVRVSKLYVAKE